MRSKGPHSLEDFHVCYHASDRGNWAAHHYGPIFIDPDHERASRHLHLDHFITKPEFPCHGGGRTAAASRSKGVTRTTFPDFNPYRLTVKDFQKLNIGPMDEEGVVALVMSMY